MRRILAAGAAITLAAGLAIAGAGTASAAPQTYVGPECNPSTVTAVLAALARNGTVLPSGSKVQYLQVVTPPLPALPYLQPCVVTVP